MNKYQRNDFPILVKKEVDSVLRLHAVTRRSLQEGLQLEKLTRNSLIEALKGKSEEDLLYLKNFGYASLKNVKKWLEEELKKDSEDLSLT